MNKAYRKSLGALKAARGLFQMMQAQFYQVDERVQLSPDPFQKTHRIGPGTLPAGGGAFREMGPQVIAIIQEPVQFTRRRRSFA